MKLLHTADWHIGKQLNEFDLLDVQQDAFKQIEAIAAAEQVDGIIIAGDLYDRAIPSTAAVKAFDQMLQQLNITDKYPIYAISGNHDGATRLNFAREWMKQNDLHLNTKVEEAFTDNVVVGDVQIFMLPFFDPQDARMYYQISIDSNEMRTIEQAMTRVVADLEQQFEPGKRHILVTHFNVQGTDNENYELTSETTSTVGGLNTVPARLFKNFDYVALGHLHLRQASPTRTVRYSGSPVKFNTKEAKNEKGVYIIDIPTTGEIGITWKTITPSKDLIVLRGDFEKLIDRDFYSEQPKPGEAFYSIQLTSRPAGKNIRKQLEDIYGDIVELEYHIQGDETQAATEQLAQRVAKTKSPEEIIGDFYNEMMDPAQLTEQQQKWVEAALIDIRKDSEA
ncbi:exonuclease SbcCD subunit D [Periweissella cryptocerci]|uniref:Nuclease SbcCD subunit D n=1 Tax=Periweissella cryptocerci TaxID=2506420 RepID=A0A4P6YU55_9LACO|nr:exonuclease SbcCD subunit D [Periweissella cryptocerci]QBO36252.1 exonuclease SbcCD subunit D [Periweissella cryptocerci]